MKKKMMKAIKELNSYIDDDREKLCDELHELKLSHKRQERLLKMSLEFLKGMYGSLDWATAYVYGLNLKKRIENELSYPYFRKNERINHG